MTKRLSLIFIFILLMTLGLGGCTIPGQQGITHPRLKNKIQVVATIYPLTDIAKNIGGNKVEVSTLIPPGASPHTFEPTPEQVKYLSKAQVLIKVGAGLDSFADKLVESTNPNLIEVEVTKNIELLDALPDNNDIQEKQQARYEKTALEETKENHHYHGEKNPHVWLDPVLVKEKIAPQIAEVLSRVSPENANYFHKNLVTYTTKLDLLHQEILDKTSKFEMRTFITFHSAWRYFSRRYNLNNLVVEEFPSKEATPQKMAEIIKIARDQGAGAIFTEPQFSSKTAEVISKEFKGQVFTVDPLGNKNSPTCNTYLKMMRYNLDIFEKVLKTKQWGRLCRQNQLCI